MDLRRLHPDPAVADAADLLGDLRLAERAPADRPYLICNFVASADGHASFEGRSGKLGGAADHEVFHLLRTQVDAVMAGTGTLRAERYGRIVRRPERRAAREAAGLAPDPPLVTITRTGRLPEDLPLLEDESSTLIVYSGAPVAIEAAATVHIVELDPAELTLTTALQRLRADHGVRSVLCEGGPTLFSALLHERLADELFLTVAPRLTGGAGLAVTAGPGLPEVEQIELVWALEHEGELFLRYRIT